MALAPTFRDPEGYCLLEKDHVRRHIRANAVIRVEEFVRSEFFSVLMKAGRVPQTEIWGGGERVHRTEENPDENRAGPTLILRHKAVPFISYPHEWCPTMLHAAGEFTLALQLDALRAGHTLKDASPMNVLFDGARPVFVDILSFVRREKGHFIWMAYAQFVRCFLLPLLLHREQNVAPHELFLAQRDGLEPEDVYHRLPWLARLKPLAFQHVTLAMWLARRGANAAHISAQPQKDDDRARSMSELLVSSLHKALQRLRPETRHSSWSNYSEVNNYAGTDFAAKERFVAESLESFAPKSVLDVGCNLGHFSRLAAKAGAYVVAVDYDPVVLDLVYRAARDDQMRITPLVVNLARPSPALGWRNAETLSFLERVEGRFNVALVLAVIHHLTVTDGIPLPEVFKLPNPRLIF